jgi:hypothetical protein
VPNEEEEEEGEAEEEEEEEGKVSEGGSSTLVASISNFLPD